MARISAVPRFEPEILALVRGSFDVVSNALEAISSASSSDAMESAI